MDTRRENVVHHVDQPIEVSDLNPDPFKQFAEWYEVARESDIPDSNAMALATASRDGIPHVRTVLLKGCDSEGLVFFTNYDSEKGQQLAENPYAAVVLFWQPLHRQIRVSGPVKRVSEAESYEYFSTRHRGSRLGAWASRQSQPVGTRKELLDRVEELEQQYPGDEIPLPPFWGGFRIYPEMFEFWEGRENRLHDRFRYTLQDDGSWTLQRLQP